MNLQNNRLLCVASLCTIINVCFTFFLLKKYTSRKTQFSKFVTPTNDYA